MSCGGLACRIKANCPFVSPGPAEKRPSVGRFLSDPGPYLREFRWKSRITPSRLDRQARQRIEPGTFCLPVLSTQPHSQWLGFDTFLNKKRKFYISLILFLKENVKKILKLFLSFFKRKKKELVLHFLIHYRNVF